MKRFFAVLVVCVLVFGMAACGKPAQEPDLTPLQSASEQGSESAPQSPAVPSEPEAAAPLLSEPEIPAEKPEPLNSEPPVQAAAQGPESSVPLTWWQEAFALSHTDGVDAVSARAYRYSDQVSVLVYDALPLLDSLHPVSGNELGAPLTDLDTLMLTTGDDTRYTLTLYEKGVTVSKAEAGGDSNTPHSVVVDAAPYAELLQQLRGRMQEGPWSASWLSLMRQSKAEKLTVTDAARKQTAVFQKEDVNFETAFCSLNSFLVEQSGTRKIGPKDKLQSATHLEIEFLNGIVYNIWMNNNEVAVTSTDMPYGLCYQAVSGPATFETMADGKAIPLTAKPVIYLYPPTPLEVSVKVHFQGRLVHTLPEYRDGWNVTAYPDGTLVDQTDGKRYDSLFWDGNARVDWDFREGFSVRGTDAERFLREKLQFLGLNVKESQDFMDFWLPELQQNRYNLITFSTEQYEALAPLEISPKPDCILRVHMVFKPMTGPADIPVQKLQPFERSGFTVVEWGGSRA